MTRNEIERPVRLSLHDAAALFERCGRGTIAASFDYLSVNALASAIDEAITEETASELCGCHTATFTRICCSLTERGNR